MHRLTELAVGGAPILAIKLSPLARGNLRLGRFYRAILIGSNAKTTSALATVINHFGLIPGAVTAPVKPFLGRTVFVVKEMLRSSETVKTVPEKSKCYPPG